MCTIGEVLGALCKKVGPETYGNVKDQILQGIRSNLERDLPVDDEDDANDVDKLMQKLGSSPGSEKVHVLLYFLLSISPAHTKKSYIFVHVHVFTCV